MIASPLSAFAGIDRTALPDLPPPVFYSTEVESKPEKGESNARKVFVVDDERYIADGLAEILQRFGFDAVPFYSGESAIDSARKHCPETVVSDVIMPRLNGVETALTIRELCPATRILLFSGQAGTADILKEARSKGHEFELLSKPIHPDELLRKLR